MSETSTPPTKLDNFQIGAIVAGVVGTVLLIVVLTVLLLQQTTASGSGDISGTTTPPTNTNFLVASTVIGTEQAPAFISGPFQAFVDALNFVPTSSNLIWITGNQSMTLSPTWLRGCTSVGLSNQLKQFTVPGQTSPVTMKLGFGGFAFNTDTTLPTDTDIPIGNSFVFTVASPAQATQDITLANGITLAGDPSDYFVFAQNGDSDANRVLLPAVRLSILQR